MKSLSPSAYRPTPAVTCTRCTPTLPCLSHTPIPYAGTCWFTREERKAAIAAGAMLRCHMV